jgi:hypothetical protein
MRMAAVAVALICLAHAARAEEKSDAETLMRKMPCASWTLMMENEWKWGGKAGRAAIEPWTIRFLRGYAKSAVERFKKDEPQHPESHWKNADGADIADRRILDWFSVSRSGK